jgi:CubicO group peptidase (beta-lactamase class C family)
MKNLLYLLPLLMLLSCGEKKQDERLATLDKYLQGQVQYYKFNGNVLVAEKGKVIYQKSFGWKDAATNEPLNDSSVFELASVSKQFTATAIMLLAQRKQLSLDDSLRKYFPELPYPNITLHQMLTHTSGLPDYESAMETGWDKKKIAFNKDMIAFLAATKPAVKFKPGTKWEYSNTAYALLASVVEKVSGMSFAEFLSKNIFVPLGMTHTRIYNTRRSGELLANYAFGHVWSESKQRHLLPDSSADYDYVYYLDGITGDGTVNSTTGDLWKWDRAWVNKTLLDEASLQKMVQPHALSDTAANVSYGYGLFVGKNHLGNNVGHSGGWPGYHTQVTRYTDEDRTIIVLSNNESPARFIETGIANILYGQPVLFPYEHKQSPADSASLALFTGKYSFNNWNFELKQGKDTIFQSFGGYGKRIYLPESNTKLFPTDGQDIQFEIEKDSNNQIKHYVIVYGVKEEMRIKN